MRWGAGVGSGFLGVAEAGCVGVRFFGTGFGAGKTSAVTTTGFAAAVPTIAGAGMSVRPEAHQATHDEHGGQNTPPTLASRPHRRMQAVTTHPVA